MRERKKYLVNILSYKYKKDSMKLFPSILSKNKILNPSNIDLDIPITNVSNLCPGGKNCPNYIVICQLEKQIKSLNDTIYQLKQINEYCDIKVNDLPLSELKINESLMSEKSDKTSELCNSFRNSSIKRSNSAFDDKLNNQNSHKNTSRFRTLSNDSDTKNKGEFNYMRNRIKCFNLNKELNSGNLNFSESEKQFSQESKIKAYKIFQSNFLNKNNINKNEEEKEKDINIEKNNRIFNNNNKIFFRNKNEENSYDKIKESEPCSSPPIKILKNNLFGVNNINTNKEIKFLKTADNEINKNNQGTKNKINYFNGLKAFRQIKNPIKFNLNNNNNERLSNHKIIPINPDNNKITNSNDNNKIHKISNNNTELILKEFNNFIKNYEYKSNYKNGELIFNRLYELTSPKDKKLLDNIKSLSDEDIYKYSSLINYSLKYISNITSFIQKIKYFCNYNSNSNPYINIFSPQSKNNREILTEEFYKYKEECKNLLKCEKVNIYLYDINSDCLILKEENNDKKYPKDKDLIGLSFTSCKKIRHDPSLSNSQIFPTAALEQRLKLKINNLLIFPIRDREKNVLGIIEVINKIKDEDNKNSNKSFFDKNDELLLDLITGKIGILCKYFNVIENQNNCVNNYHYILEFWNKLFYKSSFSPSLYLVIEEFTKLMKKIYNVIEIQFLLYINHNLYDIQKNKNMELGGLIYKCLQEKKIIFSSDPLTNKNYSINIDLPVINNYKDSELLNHDQLITFPIFYGSLEDNDSNNKIQNIIMIIQIKAKNIIQLSEINKENEELNEENKIIIEYSSYLIQKYLEENKEIINKFKYLI